MSNAENHAPDTNRKLKDVSDIVWYNFDAQPLSLLSDLSAPLDTPWAATSKGTSSKGKESAILVSGNRTIRATLFGPRILDRVFLASDHYQ